MSKVTKSKARTANFQEPHTLEYVLTITERQLNPPKTILSMRCLFYVYIGREIKSNETRQRQQTTNEKDFKWSSFRTKLYKKYHNEQHPEAWRQYQALSSGQKLSFFDAFKERFANTIPATFGPRQISIIFDIDASIVDIIIGNMFFHFDDRDSMIYSNAMKLFKSNESGGYSITRHNSLQFRLITRLIAADLSFRQVETVLNVVKAETGLARIGSINDTGIADNARVICEINLRLLSHLLNDAST